jgi:hypothetical protein
MARSAEAREAFGRQWRELRRSAEGEYGLHLRRSGWILLALAFCSGLALGERIRHGRPSATGRGD